VPKFSDFSQATFRSGAEEVERPRKEARLLGSVVYRPNDISAKRDRLDCGPVLGALRLNPMILRRSSGRRGNSIKDSSETPVSW